MNELSQSISQLPFAQLVLKSGPVAFVLLGLIAIMSIISWGAILAKAITTRKEASTQKSWSKQWGNNPSLISLRTLANSFPKSSVQRIAQAAVLEIEGFAPSTSYNSLEARKSILQETIDRAIEAEVQQSNHLLSSLSLFSSVSPFLGLLGTVWGIMHSFLDIGEQSSASLNVVAPGIAEALVTTIAGLLVAVPTSASYYFYANANKKAEAYWYQLGSEILSLFQKQDLANLEQRSSNTFS